MSAPVLLQRQQLDLLWSIDRSEIIDTLYRLQDGELQPYAGYYDVRGWDPHDKETYAPLHERCFDRGGTFFALFEHHEIVAAAAVDTELRGPDRDLRQLLFFYVSAHKRGQGLGKRLFQLCLRQAGQQGAAGLYVSSIPNKNTVDFYLAQGCRLIKRPDAELFAREPEDIHLACYCR
ncbi:GNAT family N-acetyltransferase [Serratia entomophila]|uniref:GNAT family N-acetyltransferase n=1 Tax=Serratia entomophila TaxID=42906 RepID=UPI0021780C9D|nr:GNAT family N-acetyltransferase [Serratia entomophila]CAI1101630.1 Predicted acetyltransferase [Serratia entomophila]CAI1975600.1 Predicted acetyltransferase [Serratia entomophila]CAI2403853.1 Predicted acetyltransferase [Serratia entomophila]